MKRLLGLILGTAVLTAACNGSKPGPGPSPTPVPEPASVAGNWSGTWEDNDGVTAFVMNLNQSGTTVTGTWSLTDFDWNGNVTGTVDENSFTGNFTVNAGGFCTATAAFSGPANAEPQTLRWSSVGMTGCPFGVGAITISVQKR